MGCLRPESPDFCPGQGRVSFPAVELGQAESCRGIRGDVGMDVADPFPGYWERRSRRGAGQGSEHPAPAGAVPGMTQEMGDGGHQEETQLLPTQLTLGFHDSVESKLCETGLKGNCKGGVSCPLGLSIPAGVGQALGADGTTPCLSSCSWREFGTGASQIWECHPSSGGWSCKLTRKWEFCLYKRSLIDHQSPPLVRDAVSMLWAPPGCACGIFQVDIPAFRPLPMTGFSQLYQ